MNAKAISEKKSNGGCLLVGMGIAFTAAGLFFLWLVFLSPLIQSFGSSSWPQTQCKILKSKIKVERDSDGNSYKPIVEYEYVVDGTKYLGDSPTFEDISASRKWAKGIVNKYTVGEDSMCFYDPNDHGTSVLDREFLLSFYTFALFPLLFVAIGLGIIGSGIFGWGNGNSKPPKTVSGHVRSPKSSFAHSSRASKIDANGMHEGDLLDQEWAAPKRLARTQSRWGVLIMIVLFAGLWNSFVGFFVFSEIKNGFDWFTLLFMTPFVLVGLLLLFGVVYALLALLNPKVEIALGTGAVGPGETVDIAWEVNGNVSKFKTLMIEVRGRQKATYRRGTDTYTEEETFELIPILNTNQTEEMEFGSSAVTVPAETMHTFSAGNNNIRWEVIVHGDIPWWPDVKEAFEFRVRPV